jgi:GDP-D-mannose dehydratase
LNFFSCQSPTNALISFQNYKCAATVLQWENFFTKQCQRVVQNSSRIGWKAKTKFEDLVMLMIKSDMEKVLRRGY